MAGRVEVSEDIAQMNDACRYKIHGGVFEMLVETVIVAVANHGISNRLSIRDLVVALPTNLT